MSAQKFFEITRRELNKMVTWNDDAPVAEFWEMFDRADWDVAQLRAQAARVEAAEAAVASAHSILSAINDCHLNIDPYDFHVRAWLAAHAPAEQAE